MRAVDDQVGIYGPESQRLWSEIGTQMSSLRAFGQHTACGSNSGEHLLGYSPVVFRDEVQNIDQVLAGRRGDPIPANRRTFFPPGSERAASSSRRTRSPSSPSPRFRDASPSAIFAFTSRRRFARIPSAASSNRSASCTTSLADVYLPD